MSQVNLKDINTRLLIKEIEQRGYKVILFDGRENLKPDLSKCPICGGPADNGHDRCYPPNPYLCTKCTSSV